MNLVSRILLCFLFVLHCRLKVEQKEVKEKVVVKEVVKEVIREKIVEVIYDTRVRVYDWAGNMVFEDCAYEVQMDINKSMWMNGEVSLETNMDVYAFQDTDCKRVPQRGGAIKIFDKAGNKIADKCVWTFECFNDGQCRWRLTSGGDEFGTNMGFIGYLDERCKK